MSFECKGHHQAIAININSPVSTPAFHALLPTCARLPNCCFFGLWGCEHASARQKVARITSLLFAMPLQTPAGLWPAKNCCCRWSEAFLMSHFWESLRTALAFQGGVGGDGCWSLAPQRLLPGYAVLRDSRGTLCAWIVKQQGSYHKN